MATKNNKKDGATVKGTSKADNITNSGNNVSINAGKGNDIVSIASGTQNSTVDGGAGDDTIMLTATMTLSATAVATMLFTRTAQTIRFNSRKPTVWMRQKLKAMTLFSQSMATR